MYNSSPIKTAMENPNFKGTLRVSSQALTTRSLQPVSRRGYYGKFIKHQTQWAIYSIGKSEKTYEVMSFVRWSTIYRWLSHMTMDQYLLIPFLGGWTSIYQLFWCSPGVHGFDPSPYDSIKSLAVRGFPSLHCESKTAPGGQPYVLRKVEDRTRSQMVWGPRWSQPTNILGLKPATSLGMAGMAGMAQIYDADVEIA
jgi:hypothetical protein